MSTHSSNSIDGRATPSGPLALQRTVDVIQPDTFADESIEVDPPGRDEAEQAGSSSAGDALPPTQPRSVRSPKNRSVGTSTAAAAGLPTSTGVPPGTGRRHRLSGDAGHARHVECVIDPTRLYGVDRLDDVPTHLDHLGRPNERASSSLAGPDPRR